MQANEIIAKYAAAEARCVAIAESENPFEMATEYAPGLVRTNFFAVFVVLQVY